MSAIEALSHELRDIPGLRLWPRAPLAPFTTIGVGGRGSLLVSASSPEAVAAAAAVLQRSAVAWAVIGAGSNLLVADQGFDGVVVKLDEAFAFVQPPRSAADGSVRLVAGGAAILARLASLTADHGLAGLEFACGIPGTLGGGVLMNAGAHGGSLSSVVTRVQVASASGVSWLDAGRLAWAYRTSGLPDDFVVTAVELRLVPDDPGEVRARQRDLLRARGRTQPRGVRTFGSTFKNPRGDTAGRLLDQAGLKGVRRGGAQVSPVHANFITNLGDATSADVLALMLMMWETVRHRFDVELEPEVHVLGVAA